VPTSINAVAPFPNILPAGSQLIAESFVPPTGTINPGETVTLVLSLTNSGSASTTNLVATLLAANGVTPVTVTQTYGAVAPGGGSVSQPFTLTAGGGNGGTLVVTLMLQDGTTSLGTAVFNFSLPATNTFANATPIVIPDHGAATPYPSTIVVSGLGGVTGTVTATLSNFSHSFPNDVQALLVGPSGQKSVLMAGTGGPYSVTNLTLTFADSAGVFLPATNQLFTGTFKPTDDLPLPLFPSPAPTGPYTAPLNVFDGTLPNGTWSLFVFDNSPGDSGIISGGWSLNLTTIQLLIASGPNLAVIAHPNGSFTLTLSGQPGQEYIIDASTDLINWSPVATNTPVSGSFQFTDSNVAGFPARYFRARLGP